MNQTARTLAIVGWILVVVLAALAWQGYQTAREARFNERAIATQLDELSDALAASRRVSLIRAEALENLQKKQATSKKEVHDALQANPDWASVRIPDSVYYSLSGPKH